MNKSMLKKIIVFYLNYVFIDCRYCSLIYKNNGLEVSCPTKFIKVHKYVPDRCPYLFTIRGHYFKKEG